MAIVREGFHAGSAVDFSSQCSVTVSSANAGDTIIGFGLWQGSPTFSSIVCSGETVTLRGSLIDWAGNHVQWFSIDNVASGGGKTITQTLSGIPDWSRIRAWRLSGADTASPIDAGPVNSQADNAVPSVNITTITDNAAILSYLTHTSDGSVNSIQSGFTGEGMGGNDWNLSNGQYDIDVGAAGLKSVGYGFDFAADHMTTSIAIEVGGAPSGQPANKRMGGVKFSSRIKGVW